MATVLHHLQQQALGQMQLALREYTERLLACIAQDFRIPYETLLEWAAQQHQVPLDPSSAATSPASAAAAEGTFCHFFLDKIGRKCKRLAKTGCKFCAWHDPSIQENYDKFWAGKLAVAAPVVAAPVAAAPVAAAAAAAPAATAAASATSSEDTDAAADDAIDEDELERMLYQALDES